MFVFRHITLTWHLSWSSMHPIWKPFLIKCQGVIMGEYSGECHGYIKRLDMVWKSHSCCQFFPNRQTPTKEIPWLHRKLFSQRPWLQIRHLWNGRTQRHLEQHTITLVPYYTANIYMGIERCEKGLKIVDSSECSYKSRYKHIHVKRWVHSSR